jgi:ubiquinone biosynthesis protein Coq4
MIVSPALKGAFENAVEAGSAQTFEDLVQITLKEINSQILAEWKKVGQPKGWGVSELLKLPVILCRASLIDPTITSEAIDGLSKAWLENPSQILQDLACCEKTAKAPQALWQLFWEDVKAPPLRVEPDRVQQFHLAMDSELSKTFEQQVLEGKGVAEALKTRFVRPTSMTLEDLADYPNGTLGYAFYHQLADNNLELEIVKDRPYHLFDDERVNFIALRLYQTHDIWHVLLGYSVSGLDEISLQAFQLAQVGSASSARLLALLVSRAMLKGFYALPPLFNAIFKGWQHGRKTPGLLAVPWEEMWNQPLNALRTRYQIEGV